MQRFWVRVGVAAVFLLSGCIVYSHAHAGAWVPPKNSGVFIVSTTMSEGASLYDSFGDITGSIDFKKTESVYYLERGLGHRLAFVGSASLQTQDITNEFGRDAYFGLGEATLGLRYNVAKSGGLTVSVQPSVFYTGQNEKFSTIVKSSKTPSAELRGLIGYGRQIGDISGFVDLQAARRMGFDIIPDEWRLDATVGVSPTDRIELLAQAFWSKSALLNNAPRVALPTESLKGQFSIVYRQSDKMAYQIGIGRTLQGKRIIRENMLTAGVWRTF